MSSWCISCKGTGKVDRILFGGQKPCGWCGGSGERQDLGDVMRDARFAYQDMADDWMDRRDPDIDWGPEFEDGFPVPGEAAEKWAKGPGTGWDGL